MIYTAYAKIVNQAAKAMDDFVGALYYSPEIPSELWMSHDDFKTLNNEIDAWADRMVDDLE